MVVFSVDQRSSSSSYVIYLYGAVPLFSPTCGNRNASKRLSLFAVFVSFCSLLEYIRATDQLEPLDNHLSLLQENVNYSLNVIHAKDSCGFHHFTIGHIDLIQICLD